MLLLLLLNMNSQQLSAVSTFSTNENKALLWSVLQGGGKFVGIPESLRHNIQEMFESTIREIGEHYRRLNQPVNLNAVNKEAVVIICKKIDAVKEQRQPPQEQRQPPQEQRQQIYQKKQQQVPQLETVYTAQDLQKERQNAFQNEFKKKEEEMSSILRLKKPEEINFTDDVYDKPIGNDMERLLAEALASREKELEQIKNVAFPPPSSSSLSDSYKPSTSTATSTATSTVTSTATSTARGGENVGIEKRVSFGRELHVIENRHQYEDEDEHNNGTNDDGDISFIFNKLKKIKTHKNEQHQNEDDKGNYVNENNINSHAIIIKMSQDIEYIKTALTELLEKINK